MEKKKHICEAELIDISDHGVRIITKCPIEEGHVLHFFWRGALEIRQE